MSTEIDHLKAMLDSYSTALEENKSELASSKMNNVIIPIIRRIMPGIIASQVVGVKPMGNMWEKFSVGSTEEIDGQLWYNITCDDEIWQWVIDTIDPAQYQDGTNDFQNRMTLSEQAMMLFKLKWS